MKFVLWIKSFIAANKLIVATIAIPFVITVTTTAIFVLSNSSQNQQKVLGDKTDKKLTITPTELSTPTLKPVVTVTSTNNPQTVISTPTQVPVSSPTTPPAASGEYVVSGATFSSLYPSVSLKPGDQKVAFKITSTGTKTFDIYDARVIGVNGVTFSPMSGSIEPGQTKDIIISVDPNATPGSYGGFIGIKVDSGYLERKLNITATIEGGDSNTKVLKVTGPAGGSVYKEGDDIVITWEANNISDKFGISVSGENGSPLTFANELDNSTRSYTWKAQRFFAPNSTRFRFTVTAGSIIAHSSDDIIINP